MASCPLCHGGLPDDFGLLECGSCGAQLMVYMDGRAEYQGARELPPDELADESAPAEEDQFATIENLGEIDFGEPSSRTQVTRVDHEMSAGDLVSPPDTGADHLMPEDDVFGGDLESVGEEPSLEPASPVESEYQASESAPADDSAYEISSVHDSVPPAPAAGSDDLFFEDAAPAAAVYNSTPSANSADLSDVADFGNSDASGGRDGSLRYNLFIEGIDTSDVREAFREALTDRKLMWDTDQILRSIRHGQVKIVNVAPAKAYILIGRLRSMPVQIKWEQYAISQA